MGKRERVFMVQEWVECPFCHGYGKVARVINWETEAVPCDNCGEDGYFTKDVPLEEALQALGIQIGGAALAFLEGISEDRNRTQGTGNRQEDRQECGNHS